MSIADIMAELEAQDWKAGDKETDFSVADGVYEGVIEGLEYKENEKGTQWFSFTINLINENKKYFANIYFSGKMAAMNLKKFINIILNLTGEALTSMDFANEVALTQRLNDELIGKEVVIELTTRKDFQNFKFIFQE